MLVDLLKATGVIGGDTPGEAAVKKQAAERLVNEEAFDPSKLRDVGSTAQARAGAVADRGTLAGFQQGAQQRSREQQQQLASALQARTQGTGGPSVAETQFQQSQQSNLRQALAAAAAQRGGGNVALQQRSLGNALAESQLGAAGQAAALRAAEQTQAEQTLGGLLSGQRTQDIGAEQARTGANLEAERIRGGLEQGYLGQALGAEQAALGSQQALESLFAQKQLGFLGASAAERQANNQLMGSMFQAGGTAVGAMYGGPAGAAKGGQVGAQVAKENEI